MKKYITIKEAIEHCDDKETLIPSGFLSALFPNNFGNNLCAVKGFEVDMTDYNQYKSIRIDFSHTEKSTFEEDNK